MKIRFTGNFMGFVDPLAAMLLSLGISAALIAAYFYMAAQGKDMKELVIPSFAFGFLILRPVSECPSSGHFQAR